MEGVEDAVEVDAGDVLPVAHFHLVEGLETAGDAGVRDHHVEATEEVART